jgi:hypothetical protein
MVIASAISNNHKPPLNTHFYPLTIQGKVVVVLSFISANSMLYQQSNSKNQANCLMTADGEPVFGQFEQPMQDLSLSTFCYFNSMDKKASKFSQYFHYKQFQFVTINTGQYIIGAAIADIRYLGSGFLYLYDIANNTLLENNWLRPPTIGYHTTPSAHSGSATIGGEHNNIGFTIKQGHWHLEINSPKVKASLSLNKSENNQPLAMCSPAGYNGWTYTEKHNGLAVEGQLFINQQPQALHSALASYDFSAGYMRRETSWRWASINGLINDKVFGLNLAAGVNETGITENAYWLNGQRHYLPPVQFSFQRDRSKQSADPSWSIASDHSVTSYPKVALEFTPVNSREERLNLGFLKSNFRQYIGYYHGVITDLKGNNIHINNLIGLSEDHFARW